MYKTICACFSVLHHGFPLEYRAVAKL